MSALWRDLWIWAICAVAIVGLLARPRGIAEWIWALAGAVVLVVTGAVAPTAALGAIGRGANVYFFLAGMMVLSEVARREGVFDWIAAHAVDLARGSRLRLFAIVYGVGVVVTAVLSNDATAVVLTPAVAAAARAARVARPLPYLYACALVANAASFILPISNPANLVIYGDALPPLGRWFGSFALPSVAAVVVTFVALAIYEGRDLRGRIDARVDVPGLRPGGAIALAGIALAGVALLVASSFGLALGIVTLACAAAVFAGVGIVDRGAFAAVARDVSWTVLALVAGLFVLVEAAESTGVLALARAAVETLARGDVMRAAATIAASTALVSNVTNNLPSGLLAGAAVAQLHGHAVVRDATVLGIDLGPNLSVTGSLATVLWMIALRREKIETDAWAFFRMGCVVMPPALALAVVALVASAR